MAYIGRGLDKISNVEKLDNLTFDGSSQSFTLQKGGVDFTPSGSNNILLSIDGVVQAGNFTVSGSSIDLGEAISASATCDFVLHYGVGVITTPADDTVATAKLQANSVTSAKLNNDIISGATELASEPADTDEFLVSDAGTIKRIDYSLIKGGGITSAQEFRLVDDQSGSGSNGTVLSDWEENDTDYQGIGSAWSQSSGIFSCSSTGIYLCHFRLIISGASANDAFDPNIQISTDSGSTYTTRATAWEYVNSTDTGASPSGFFMFDVANTSTFRLRFRESGDNDIGTTSTIKGDSSSSETNIIFTRLGDT